MILTLIERQAVSKLNKAIAELQEADRMLTRTNQRLTGLVRASQIIKECKVKLLEQK